MECVEKVIRGETECFDLLVERYRSKVQSLVYNHVRQSETAQDLTQDIFFKVFRKLDKFKGESKFSSWLYRIAVNECIDYIRSHKKKAEESLELAFEKGFEVLDTSEYSDVQGRHERKVERQLVQKALATLTPEMRSVIVLKVYEERTFEEISEILSIPTSTVKSRLYKALENLGRSYRRRTLLREVTP